MVRFPHILEMRCAEVATLNPDGTWSEGAQRWHTVGRCNARAVGRAQQTGAGNGHVYLYSFEVTLPADTPPIAIGTPVRIFDKRGVNIFDQSPHCDGPLVRDSPATYPVQGFRKSGQRHEYTTLWL